MPLYQGANSERFSGVLATGAAAPRVDRSAVALTTSTKRMVSAPEYVLWWVPESLGWRGGEGRWAFVLYMQATVQVVCYRASIAACWGQRGGKRPAYPSRRWFYLL